MLNANILKKLGPIGNIEFDKLFLGQIFSHFSDAIVQFLMVSILLQTTSEGAGKSIAIIFFAFLLPQFLISPVSGALCDRLSRKAILSISCLYRVLIVALLILNLNNITQNLIYTFSFALGLGAAFFYPAKMAAITNVVKSSQLKFANALNSSIGAIALLLGAFVANFLTTFGNFKALAIVGLMYLAGAAFCALVKFLIPQKTVKKENTGTIAALKYLKSHKKALYLVMLSICLQFIVAVFSNSLNALITDYYGLTFKDLTYLRTLLGIGIVSGMAATIFFARFMRTPHLFASAFGVLCLALMTAPLCKSLDTAWMWLLPIGMADAVVLVMLDTIIQKAAPDRVRGK